MFIIFRLVLCYLEFNYNVINDWWYLFIVFIYCWVFQILGTYSYTMSAFLFNNTRLLSHCLHGDMSSCKAQDIISTSAHTQCSSLLNMLTNAMSCPLQDFLVKLAFLAELTRCICLLHPLLCFIMSLLCSSSTVNDTLLFWCLFPSFGFPQNSNVMKVLHAVCWVVHGPYLALKLECLPCF